MSAADIDALYFLNMDELACSDLDALDRLEVDSSFPYRDPHASSEIERNEKKEAKAKYRTLFPSPAPVPPVTLRVPCPSCGAVVGKMCKRKCFTIYGKVYYDRTCCDTRYHQAWEREGRKARL